MTPVAGVPEFDSGWGCFAIIRSDLIRNSLFAALALLLGFSGGLAGGLVADRSSGSDEVAPTPVAVEVVEPAGGDVRTAVQRALPAVVTVLADFAPERLSDGRVSERQNVGSGVVISDGGHVITNYHVISGAQRLTVVLATGEERPAVQLSNDAPYTDLAVLRIAPQGLRMVPFGDSAALVLGDPVMAVAGGLLGFQHSVTLGVVSTVGRSWPRNGVILEDLVQTDAAVNHGDSGGALVNLDGELVGLITTVVRNDASGQAVQGVAFAQSSNSLRPVVEEIIATGSFPRARPGVERHGTQHIELSPELAVQQELPVPFGALVIAPEPGSPAEAAGVRPGDIIVAMNGVAVDFDNPLPNLLKRLPFGVDADFLVFRGGRQLIVTVSPWLE